MSDASHKAFDGIVLGGLLKPRGMPARSDVLSPDDSRAIYTYLIDQQRQAYEGQRQPSQSGGKPRQDVPAPAAPANSGEPR